MITWPAQYEVLWESIRFARQPAAARQSSFTGKVRQRQRYQDDSLLFTVDVLLADADVEGFADFIKANPNTFTGPYYTCDVEQTATLQVQGQYTLTPQPPSYHVATLTIKVLDRSYGIGQQLYDLAQSMGSAFDELGSISEALAVAVNENNL